MNIQTAQREHTNDVARLFDLYRQFYQCEPDLELAQNYIGRRIERQESQIFFAEENGDILGFVQLYPTFCSVQAVKIFVLYDLFVEASARKKGCGELLMNRAKKFAIESGASRIDLQTAFTNLAGQHLYEKLGYKKVLEEFHTYSLAL